MPSASNLAFEVRKMFLPERAAVQLVFSLLDPQRNLLANVCWLFLANVPSDLSPWRIVYHYFRIWTRSGWWKHLHDHLRSQLRAQEGRKPQPTTDILDSQSIKMASPASERGFDAAKKITGRKRHIAFNKV